MGKKWYTSKTVWFNVVGAGAMFLANQFGVKISPEVQAGILTGINLILRIVTKDQIVW